MAAARAVDDTDTESVQPHAEGAESAGSVAPYQRSSSGTQLRAAQVSEETAYDSGFAVTVVPPPMDPVDPGDVEGEDGATRPAAVLQAEQRLLEAIRNADLAGALTVASVLVYLDPSNELARRIKDRCAQQMEAKRTLSFPRPDAVPRQCVPWSELRRRTLSRSEAYLLWCVDGKSTVEQIIDASAMPPLLAFETLDALIREGIVDLS
jgi:hypothetical protein